MPDRMSENMLKNDWWGSLEENNLQMFFLGAVVRPAGGYLTDMWTTMEIEQN